MSITIFVRIRLWGGFGSDSNRIVYFFVTESVTRDLAKIPVFFGGAPPSK